MKDDKEFVVSWRYLTKNDSKHVYAHHVPECKTSNETTPAVKTGRNGKVGELCQIDCVMCSVWYCIVVSALY